MNFDADLEKRLESIAMPYLKSGRGEFDVNHTFAAVAYMKELARAEGCGERLLVICLTTMYLHDIGYSGLFKDERCDFYDIMANKKNHMELGAAEAKKILPELGYSRREIAQIAYLIRDHDRLEKLDREQATLAAQLVFEADSLGQLAVETTFEKSQYFKALSLFESGRVPRFKTRKGKELLGPLLENARHRYD